MDVSIPIRERSVEIRDLGWAGASLVSTYAYRVLILEKAAFVCQDANVKVE